MILAMIYTVNTSSLPICTTISTFSKSNYDCGEINQNITILWRERKTQQDATIRCLLSTSISTCFGHHYVHLQENKDRVTAFGLLLWFCWMWLVTAVGRCLVGCEHCEGFEQKPSLCSHPTTQRPTTVTNHIQQNQSSKPNAVTRSLFSWRWT